jgi:hypothetical protein
MASCAISLSVAGGDEAGVDSLASEGVVAIDDVMIADAIDEVWSSKTSKIRESANEIEREVREYL